MRKGRLTTYEEVPFKAVRLHEAVAYRCRTIRRIGWAVAVEVFLFFIPVLGQIRGRRNVDRRYCFRGIGLEDRPEIPGGGIRYVYRLWREDGWQRPRRAIRREGWRLSNVLYPVVDFFGGCGLDFLLQSERGVIRRECRPRGRLQCEESSGRGNRLSCEEGGCSRRLVEDNTGETDGWGGADNLCRLTVSVDACGQDGGLSFSGRSS